VRRTAKWTYSSEALRAKGLADDNIARLWDSLDVPEDNPGALASLEQKLDARGAEGVAALRDVLAAAEHLGVPTSRLRVDPSLARGLDYYTGPVFEAEVVEPAVGSICGGGRYDHLIGMFSGRDIPAVGVSLGLERIIAVMEAQGMLPGAQPTARVLVTVFDDRTRTRSLEAAAVLRAAGIATDLYLGEGRLKNQLKQANARGYPWLIVIGPDEVAAGAVSLKDLTTGEQEALSLEGAIRKLAGQPRPKG